MGQSDYTSANIYLDAYSYYRNRRSPNTIVINWGPWKETGMAADYKVEDVLPIKQLSTKGALKAYDIILSKQVTQIWVGSLNVKVSSIDEFYLPLSEKLSDRYKNKDVKPQPEKVEQVFSFDDLNPDDVVSLVSSIWERVLEIKQIDIYKNFTQLGGDSIIATYLVKEMENNLGNIIDITDILLILLFRKLHLIL